MRKGSSVLVVEDNSQNMMMMRDLLQVHGYEVLEASTGKQGWELAREHRPDLILMDIQLPDVSGLEVTKWLKNDESLRSIPVLAITAFAMKGDGEMMLETGCDGYISKPISVAGILQTVEQFIGSGTSVAAAETGPGHRELSSS
jgi:two-component system cell cycle response regulator DivK